MSETFRVIELDPGDPRAIESARMRAEFDARMANVSLDSLYELAGQDWSNVRERFPTRETVLNALFSISRLKH